MSKYTRILSKDDWELVLKVLKNPPEPNQALKDAHANYKKHVGSDFDGFLEVEGILDEVTEAAKKRVEDGKV